MSLDFYNQILQNEIELLKVIYEKEFSLSFRETSLRISINLPLESIKDSQKNFINLRIEIICDINYPDSVPEIVLSDYWGLDDCDIADLYGEMRSYLSIGISDPEALIFNVIQQISNRIDDNIPKCKCSICLDNFVNSADVFVTPLHHYFHESCIGNYAIHQSVEHQAAVIEAKRNNKFISDSELPQLNMKCPLCRSEDLIFDCAPRDSLDSWKKDRSVESSSFLNTDIVVRMEQMSLRRDEQLQRQQLLEAMLLADNPSPNDGGPSNGNASQCNLEDSTTLPQHRRQRRHNYRGHNNRQAERRNNNWAGSGQTFYHNPDANWKHTGGQFRGRVSSNHRGRERHGGDSGRRTDSFVASDCRRQRWPPGTGNNE